MRNKGLLLTLFLLWTISPTLLPGQTDAKTLATLEHVLERLDTLEQQNKELLAEIKALKSDLAVSRSVTSRRDQTESSVDTTAPLDERVGVLEHRVEEQAQTKVEAARKLPVRISGMLLFNSFMNSKGSSPSYVAGASSLYFVSGPSSSGATVRQSLLGFDFDGPTVLHGGKVTGLLSLDFSGGTNLAYGVPRIRRGVVAIDWSNREFEAGQDNLLVSPRAPTSLAEVSVPALSGAGNLWIWVPQARYEERYQFGSSTGIRLQASVLQTAEQLAQLPAYYPPAIESARAGGEGRVELWHRWGEGNRAELAAGVHRSTTHVGGASIPSFLYSFDGLVRPTKWLEVTGTYFSGENLAALSGPALGFVYQGPCSQAIRAEGGWLQTAFPFTKRLTLNAFAGWQSTGENGLYPGQQRGTIGYAANFIYRLGPNVLVSAEAGQYRYSYLYSSQLLRNHYDLALAYTF